METLWKRRRLSSRSHGPAQVALAVLWSIQSVSPTTCCSRWRGAAWGRCTHPRRTARVCEQGSTPTTAASTSTSGQRWHPNVEGRRNGTRAPAESTLHAIAGADCYPNGRLSISECPRMLGDRGEVSACWHGGESRRHNGSGVAYCRAFSRRRCVRCVRRAFCRLVDRRIWLLGSLASGDGSVPA
jgi:hypothetical protein